MTNIRRWFTVALALCLVLTLTAPIAGAADSGTLTITSGEVAAGQSVTLTIKVEDNPGMAACLVYIYYDTDVFTADPGEDMDAAGPFGSAGMFLGNSIDIARKNGRYDGDPADEGLLGVWFNSSGVNTTKDGDLMTVTLHAKSGVKAGEYPIKLGYSQDDTCTDQGKAVVFKTVAGKVAVTGGESTGDAPATPDQPTNPTTPPATTEPDGPAPVQFIDIAGHWAEASILDAANRKLINGYPEGTYLPEKTMTRAEFVTVLWRAMGEPAAAKSASFTDLEPGQTWYHAAVAWAEESKAVNGKGNGKFDPNGTISRQEVVTILHRLAGTPIGMEAMLTTVYDSQYPDSPQVAAWAKSALYWSIYQSIYCGTQSMDVGQTLEPTSAASRAQIAVMMTRYLNEKTEG